MTDLEKHLLAEYETAFAAECALTEQLSAAHTKVRDILSGLVLVYWKVKPGDLVRRDDGKIFRVESVDLRDSPAWLKKQRPWVHGYLRKKDGTYMDKDRCVYTDWTLLTQQEARDIDVVDRVLKGV